MLAQMPLFSFSCCAPRRCVSHWAKWRKQDKEGWRFSFSLSESRNGYSKRGAKCTSQKPKFDRRGAVATALCRRDVQGRPDRAGRLQLPKTKLINIAVGKLKGASDQFDLRTFVFREHNFDDIEAKENVGIVEQAQPGQPTRRNSRTLALTQRLERPTEIFISARFYFHKNKRVAIATYNVNFAAAPATKVAIQDFVTAPAKKTAGEVFALFATPQMFRLRFRARNRKAAAPPVQTTGDGWGRVRIHEV